MHELSLVQGIIDIIDEYRRKHNFEKVNSITLEYGELSCINEEALKFSFEILSEDIDYLKETKLIFNKLLPKVKCENCGKENIVINDFSKCPNCRSNNIYLSGGMEELKLIEMDVE